MKFEVYTKLYDSQWQVKPKLVCVFDTFGDAYRFIANRVTNPIATAIFRQSLYRFDSGKDNGFGIGAELYCMARES